MEAIFEIIVIALKTHRTRGWVTLRLDPQCSPIHYRCSCDTRRLDNQIKQAAEETRSK